MNSRHPRQSGFSASLLPSGAGIVGIVDSPAAIRAARRLKAGTVDFLEWRADRLGGGLVDSGVPWIVTVRHPAEGGANKLSTVQRRELALELLPKAALLDLEVRSLTQMRGVIESAHAAGVGILASFHDFRKTPTASRLRETLQRAVDSGAAVVKIATVTESAADISRLLDLFESSKLPLALMGMGRLGMASRIILASAGSVLNYGWLDQPNVPGQWSAKELRAVLGKCISPAS